MHGEGVGGATDADGMPPLPPTRVTTAQLVRLGLVLTVIVAVLGSIRFARYDWTGIQLEFLPDSVELDLSPDCVEQVGSYTTDTGRVVEPLGVDDEQYMSMVSMYRGTPRAELESECLYRPWTGRFGQPWLAHWLPFDEATSMAALNSALTLIACWAMLLALRSSGVGPREFVVAGTLFAVGWNTLFFSSIILTDPGALAVVTVGWWLVVKRRLWAALVLMLIAVPIRETVLILAPVLIVAKYVECNRQWMHRKLLVFTASVGVAAAAATVLWGSVAPVADASWDSTPRISLALANLASASIVTVAIAGVPLYVPALLQWRGRIRSEGLVRSSLDPAVTGLLLAVVLCVWTLASADFSPRFLWVGFPFAASLTASWISEGHLEGLFGRIRPERLVGSGATGARSTSRR